MLLSDPYKLNPLLYRYKDDNKKTKETELSRIDFSIYRDLNYYILSP